MGKFDGWLICSDFDGTIYVDHALSDENCAAVRYFQENGGKFTFASGRFVSMFDGFCDKILPGAPIAGLNGAVIAEPCGGRVLYRGGIRRGEAVKIMLEALERYPGLRVVFSGGVASNSMLRQTLAPLNPIFAQPQFSTDNAMGVAVLAHRAMED